MLNYKDIKNMSIAPTGMCICGHHQDEHHGNFIMRPEYLPSIGQGFRDVNGILYGECEHSFVNGDRMNEQDPICYCNSFWDTGWPEKEKK